MSCSGVAFIAFEPSEDIIHVCTYHGFSCIELLCVSDNCRFCEQLHWWAKFQRTICFSKGACQVDVMLKRPVAMYLEPLVYGMSSELAKAILQISFNVMGYRV